MIQSTACAGYDALPAKSGHSPHQAWRLEVGVSELSGRSVGALMLTWCLPEEEKNKREKKKKDHERPGIIERLVIANMNLKQLYNNIMAEETTINHPLKPLSLSAIQIQ